MTRLRGILKLSFLSTFSFDQIKTGVHFGVPIKIVPLIVSRPNQQSAWQRLFRYVRMMYDATILIRTLYINSFKNLSIKIEHIL